MDNDKIHNRIKSIVHSFLPDARVLLFGSQARGEAGKDSDYDLLIISDRVAALKGKMDYESKINKALVWSLDKPFDVLVKSPDDIAKYKNAKAHIIYYALKDPIEI